MFCVSGIVTASRRSPVRQIFFRSHLCSRFAIANLSFDYAKLFSESKDGLYILLDYDEDNGKISDLRQTLKAFLEGSWGM